MEPKHLTAGHGWEWIKQGYALFMKAPLLWIVLLLICVISAAALSYVPVVGEPLVSLLMPVVLAGLMAGCRDLLKGDELELVHLFRGFQQHTTQLVTLGGIGLVSQFLIFGLMMLVGGAALVNILMSGQPDVQPEVIIEAASGAGFAMLLGIILFSLLVMAMQFAPLLVFFNGVTPLTAMKLSLRAFLKNIGSMLVYGLTFMFLAILASLPMMLGWLILLPIVFTSLYASYSEIFPAEKVTGTAPTQGDIFSRDDQTL
jgi:uncharacterized membrane protein